MPGRHLAVLGMMHELGEASSSAHRELGAAARDLGFAAVIVVGADPGIAGGAGPIAHSVPDVDSAGHLTGWMSPGQMLAIANTDGQIGQLVSALSDAGFPDTTLLIIASDHGGSGTSHGSDSPEDTIVPWLAVGPGVPAGVTLDAPIMAFDTAASALFALNLPLPAEWDGQPVSGVFDQ
jgi:hypothetical protein